MEAHALYVVVAGLGLSVVSGLLLKKIEMPVIIGYILTGLIIAALFHIQDFESLSEIADFGIVFLMFMIGLEFNFDKLKTMKQEVLLFGGLQVVVTSALHVLFGYFVMGSSWGFSFVVAMGFSLSSTAIVLKFFEESKQLNTPVGKIVVGILIFQDIAAIPILLILMLMGGGSNHFLGLLIKTIVSSAIILTLLLLPGKLAATRILSLAAESRLPEIFMGTILLIVFGAASLSHFFGFSMSLGAFVAGMAISKSRYRIRVQEEFAPLKDIFLGLFFVTVGMQIHLGFLFENFFAVIFLLSVAMFLKTGVLYVVLRVFRDSKSALKAALSLAQIGEFALVVFLSASKRNLLTLQKHEGVLAFLRDHDIIHVGANDIQQFLVLMIIFSMLITPFILKYLDSMVDFFTNKFSRNKA
ncbi:cation:proton antiporter domain-containing protein [Helicobacter ailurogastricus]|uniref:Glutathione-regulated potassium-efflux system protein KefB n=1 Tax=Helicobacter ailurogastricus TaxID=1578720 RepID=A0A0K2X7R6_9HELI|nr:cation:proton antiporter [Helicobacter ailurogastricus]CRF41744.1 Glutathione-regulated potassium-efflux system protein KefB [Helicobacter ailurogastricus]CRF42086.1 Glutathione-regulated potassium-efflux system protein KefB [Helicobacter ailurogastricus]CRF44155.1 Glutathione-regulated potassium-efflux system protein KefB [Helicobacter ailurogastricus]GLH58406.1 Glutathione-regulated potassium-efflux system protein KefB [Helicobacter ailurogastricus]GLH59480.1 Glutathione-regulated potassi